MKSHTSELNKTAWRYKWYQAKNKEKQFGTFLLLKVYTHSDFG